MVSLSRKKKQVQSKIEEDQNDFFRKSFTTLATLAAPLSSRGRIMGHGPMERVSILFKPPCFLDFC